MLSYYLVYDEQVGTSPAVGMVVLETRSGDALIWNHRSQAWQYDPQTAQRFLGNEDHLESLEVVNRARAEQAASAVTKGRGTLPDEETIYWIFQWRGAPPQSGGRGQDAPWLGEAAAARVETVGSPGMISTEDWDAERVLELLRQHVLGPGAQVIGRTDEPGRLAVQTSRTHVVAERADWLIGREPWVRLALRVVEDEHTIANWSVTYGLVLGQDGRVFYLNDIATMQRIGSRVGTHLDPMAYAELLAELYSCSPENGPTVHPTAATPAHRAGVLIRDVTQFHGEYEFVDPALVAPPRVHRADAGVVLDFFSCHYFVTPRRAIDVIKWNVICGPDGPAVWRRDYVVQRLESP